MSWRPSYWAILFALALFPYFLGMITPWFGVDLHLYRAGFRWSYLVVIIAVFILSSRIEKGQFAELAFRRMWLTTGTVMVFLAFIPSVLSLLLTTLQLHGTDHLVLDVNLLQYEYKGGIYQYSPKLWITDWLGPVLSLIANIWVTTLIMACLRQRTRDILLGTYFGLLIIAGFGYELILHKFYPHLASHRVIHSSNLVWWTINMIAAFGSYWIIYRSLERGFRPSLLPISIMLILSSIHSLMFERPSDAYALASHVLSTGVIWLALRNSKWGIEKWTEYQQTQEALQT